MPALFIIVIYVDVRQLSFIFEYGPSLHAYQNLQYANYQSFILH